MKIEKSVTITLPDYQSLNIGITDFEGTFPELDKELVNEITRLEKNLGIKLWDKANYVKKMLNMDGY